jgi:hypothetical protein
VYPLLLFPLADPLLCQLSQRSANLVCVPDLHGARCALSFIYTWLRLMSGSIWPGVLLHASHNLFTGVFDQLTVDRGYTEYVTTEFGAGLAIVYVLVAYWCWSRRGSLPHQAASETEVVAAISAQVTHP